MPRMIGTIIKISDPLSDAFTATLIPLVMLLICCKGRVVECLKEIRKRSLFGGLFFCLHSLRWYLLVYLVCFGLAWFFVIGVHRLLVAVDVQDSRLILKYPWPRSNVEIDWRDVNEAKISR